MIGVQPVLGAGFPNEPVYSRERIAVISHRLWRERFGGDPSIVGKTIALNGPLFTVVGVMPQGFQYPNDTDVWHRMTVGRRAAQPRRAFHGVALPAEARRDARGREQRAARADEAAGHRRTRRPTASTRARAVPLATEVVGFFRPALFALFGAAAFLLVITCTNVASLLLARATVREREVAVRAAIGASRGRLIRQFLTESVLLAVMGTALGVAVAVGSVKALVAATPVELPRLDERRPRWRGCCCLPSRSALLTAIAFGVVPAMLMARGDMQRPLKESGRGGDGSGARRRARSVLVVAEVGLAVMLLVGAALLARSFQRLVQQDPGFKPARAVTAKVELPYCYADFKKIVDFYDRLLTSLRAQPGVTVAGAQQLPAARGGVARAVLHPGPAAAARGRRAAGAAPEVDEDYFRAIGVPLRQGPFLRRRATPSTRPAS